MKSMGPDRYASCRIFQKEKNGDISSARRKYRETRLLPPRHCVIGRAELGAEHATGVASRSAAEDYLSGLSLTSQGIEKAILSLAAATGSVSKTARTLRRGWGTETVIFEADRVRIKSFEVNPGGAMAPGLHGLRSEHWVVAEGRAHMTIGDRTFESGPDESRYIPAGIRHFLVNPGRTRLVVIEVQCGEDLSELDVETAAQAESARDGLRASVATGDGGRRPLHVLHVYKTFLPDSVGGLETAIAQMAVSTRRLGIETRILSLSRTPWPRKRHYRATEHYRYKETASIASNAMSVPLMLGFGEHVHWADVIHYHFPWPFADLLHLLWRVRKPSVVTYHSDIVRQRALLTLYRPLMRAFLGRVNQIVATSPNYVQTSDVLRDYPDKTTVIPIGLDPASYPATRPDILERWRGQVGENFFLFIGVIRYYKGLHILLDALAGTPLPTVIVGSGPIESELRAHADRAGLTHVKFLGTVSEEDKVALLQLSAAVVFPSHLRSEAFGVTLLEGAMFSKPLISSEIGTGTSYINIDGETGLVVKPSDPVALRAAMLKMAGDIDMRTRMGAAARRRFEERFTADRMALQYVDTYCELISSVPISRAAAVSPALHPSD
jgi:rhamnosyl/mannosyltransferase